MPQIVVTRSIAEVIAAHIGAFSTVATPHQLWLAPFVAEFNALPLYVGWTEIIGIRPTGEIVSWSTEGEFEGVRPVEDQVLFWFSLVDGSRKYPELQQLLPQRVEGATDCQCRDVPLFASGKVCCSTCCGLGWVPPEGGNWGWSIKDA